MSDELRDHDLAVHAAQALGHGRVLDVVALQAPDGTSPFGAALEAARAAALTQHGVLSAHAAEVVVPGAETAGVILTVRQGTSLAKEVGTAAAHATGLAAGVATSQGHPDSPLDDLVMVALEGLGVARSDGGDHAVHSELYDLVKVLRGNRQRPLEYGAPLHDAPAGSSESDWIPRPEPHAESQRPSPPETDAESTVPSRGVRTESDDPFAYVDTRDNALTDERAAALTKGIAPGQSELAELARARFKERDAIRFELENLRLAADPTAAQDVQERRIKKLIRRLEAAEGEIEKLRRDQDADPGLASLFRSTRGLDPNEPGAETKRDMLKTVFRQNQTTDAAPDGTVEG